MFDLGYQEPYMDNTEVKSSLNKNIVWEAQRERKLRKGIADKRTDKLQGQKLRGQVDGYYTESSEIKEIREQLKNRVKGNEWEQFSD